ncbi:primosomal protein N' [Mobilicoccus pelagius NBRC 104925]|uniref:Probable replication restart protein PriA n=1 Tax=Mobilicoccus pelagius NBRC 104925 TaxID=1089455 RepID=H5UV03_9MICO|nr:primosomal protein N' [Mobilicoccus pelagius NBRC 104925]
MVVPAPTPAPESATAPTSTTSRGPAEPTAEPELPVALVAVQVPLPHLDRGFEYRVPAEMDAGAVPGARVKVRFSGREVDGFVLERRAKADHVGTLAPLRRVVSPEAVLTPEIAGLARAVADAHAGSLADVLRLAVPPRHVRAEKALTARPPTPPAEELPAPDEEPWARYPAGPSFLRRVRAGEGPWAAWSALPTVDPTLDWPAAFASAAAATLASGRGVVLVVPDHRDVARVEAALVTALGPGRHVRLTADQGPQARYTAWLSILRGHVQCVVGTRAAAYAPVHDLGLVGWWDDGDDLHAEPRAPYAHMRDVLRLRASHTGAALLVGGLARSVAIEQWVAEGVVREVVADVPERRALARVHVVGEGHDEERDGPGARAHLPSAAWRAAHAALQRGPVLVQVPRRGYLPSLSCQGCRAPARCPHCHGPLALPGPGAPPACRWCGRTPTDYTCPECGSHRLRSSVVGARRTAEELGRAFPGVPVRTSGSPEVLERVEGTPALVIATPGAEPPADGGYAATLLLDAWASLDRPALDAGEEALRRWLTAAALTRDAAAGGVVVLAGAPLHTPLPVVEALVRWAPEWFAGRELAERAELSLPPTVWMARVTGALSAVRGFGDDMVAATRAADVPLERLGPIPVGDEDAHLLLRAPLADAATATAALGAVRRTRSARKDRDAASVRIGVADVT